MPTSGEPGDRVGTDDIPRAIEELEEQLADAQDAVNAWALHFEGIKDTVGEVEFYFTEAADFPVEPGNADTLTRKQQAYIRRLRAELKETLGVANAWTLESNQREKGKATAGKRSDPGMGCAVMIVATGGAAALTWLAASLLA